MLKIGDFSRLGQVSVDTLRHYDALGLLKPTQVDAFTGYRLYSYHQLGRLNRILALKDLGLSLEQIAAMVEGDLSAEQIKGMLKFKRAEIEARIETEHEHLARVEARLRQIELEASAPDHDVVIRRVPPQQVASVRRSVPGYDQVMPLYDELLAYLHQLGVTPALAITIWHDDNDRDGHLDTEAAVTLKAQVPESATVKVYDLPGGCMASTVHNGAFDRLYQAYAALNQWIEANGYQVCGSARELYHYCQAPLRRDDECYVTEIQLPVEKTP